MTEEPFSAYSEPIGPQWHEGPPFQWKEGRAARAEAAFQEARDATISACLNKAQKETQDAHRIKDLEIRTKAQIAKVSCYEHCCRLTRACVEEAVTRAVSDTTAATNPPNHALRFPLYTALRPLVVLANPGASPSSDPPPPSPSTVRQLFTNRSAISQKGGSSSPRAHPGVGSPRASVGPNRDGGKASTQPHSEEGGCGFGEALFVRGLVSTLMANALVLGDAGVGSWGEAGGDWAAGGTAAVAGVGPSAIGAGAAVGSGAGAAEEGGRESAIADGRSSSEAGNQPRQNVRQHSTLRWSDPGFEQQQQQQQQQQHLLMAAQCSGTESDSVCHKGFAPLMAKGCRATDLVWWDALQPKMAMPDATLARLEVLRSCAVAVLVLTQAYATSNVFPHERDMAMARLVAAQRGKLDQSFTLVVIRLECMDPSLKEGQPKSSPLPPHFGPLPTPPPRPSPPKLQPSLDSTQSSGPSAILATELPFPFVEVLVSAEGSPEAQVARAVGAIRNALAPAGVVLPPMERLHVTFSPEDAVAKAMSSTPPPPTPAFHTLRTTCPPSSAARTACSPSSRDGACAGVGCGSGAVSGAAAASTQAGEGAPAGDKPVGSGNEVESEKAGPAGELAAAPARALSPFAADRVWHAQQSVSQGPFSNVWASAQQMEQQAMDSQGAAPAGSARAVLPASRIRNSLMRLGLTSTRGAPEDDDALSRVASSSLIDGPYEPGASWVASHSLILPTSSVKPLMEWSCHDVQVWVSALGKSVADAAAQPLLLYSIDGSLLHLASPVDLEVLLGVGASRQLKTSLTRVPLYRCPTSRKQHPGISFEETPLFTLSDQQLEQVFADVVRYYDDDLSGDLNVEELSRLLSASGLVLAMREVCEVRDEYDNDEDNRLDTVEAAQLMWDLWRLLLASRDAAAWNVPASSGPEFWEGTTEAEAGNEGGPAHHRLEDLKASPSMRHSFSQLTHKALGDAKGDAHATVWRWAAGRAASIARSRAVSRAASRAISRAGSVVSRANSCAQSQAPRSVHGALSVASSKVGRGAFPGGLTAEDLRILNAKWGGGVGAIGTRARSIKRRDSFNSSGKRNENFVNYGLPANPGMMSRRATRLSQEGASSTGGGTAASGADSRSVMGRQGRVGVRLSGSTATGGTSGNGEGGSPVRRNVSIAQGDTPGSVSVMGAGFGGGVHKGVGLSHNWENDEGQASAAWPGVERVRGGLKGRRSSSNRNSSVGEVSESEAGEHEAQPHRVKRLLSRIVSMSGASSQPSLEGGETEAMTRHNLFRQQSMSMGRVSFAVRDRDVLDESSSNPFGRDNHSSAGASQGQSSSSMPNSPRGKPTLIMPKLGVAPKPLPPPGAHSTCELKPQALLGQSGWPNAFSTSRSHNSQSLRRLSFNSQPPLTLPNVGMMSNHAASMKGTAASQSKRPMRLQGLTGRRSDEDDESVNGSSQGSTLATDLDVFGDFALTSARVLRATTDAEDLAGTLKSTLMGADLRRVDALPEEKLRGALVVAMGRMALSGSSPDTAGADAHGNRTCTLLTPFELHLLSNLRPFSGLFQGSHATAHAKASPCFAGEQQQQLVPIDTFIPAAVEAVARSQDVLMDVVYGPRGTQTLLMQLHMQLYPSSDGQMRQVDEHFQATGAASCKAMRSTASCFTATSFAEVPFEEAPQLLTILTNKLGVTLPLVVRTGILQEAAAAAEQCAGTGNEVSVWSCIISHMLHVFTALQRPSYSEHFY